METVKLSVEQLRAIAKNDADVYLSVDRQIPTQSPQLDHIFESAMRRAEEFRLNAKQRATRALLLEYVREYAKAVQAWLVSHLVDITGELVNITGEIENFPGDLDEEFHAWLEGKSAKFTPNLDALDDDGNPKGS